MKTIAAGKFKAQCLALIDDVHDKHEEVVITKHGKPMARLVPLADDPKLTGKPEDIFGYMRGWGRIVGDIVSPIDPNESWDMEK